jgi:uncharacterized protein YifE (UPF0438 family)
MGNWKAIHLAVARKPFGWLCDRRHFSPQEIDYLTRWGSWLEALWRQELKPETVAQERFVYDVCFRDGEPKDTVPCLWLRYVECVAARIMEPDMVDVSDEMTLAYSDYFRASRAYRESMEDLWISEEEDHLLLEHQEPDRKRTEPREGCFEGVCRDDDDVDGEVASPEIEEPASDDDEEPDGP